jgi:H+/gluconate symporter-like permease
MDLLSLLLGIIALMIAIYKGKNIVIVVPIILFCVIVLSNEWQNFIDYGTIYILALFQFFRSNLILFYLGVLFGTIISETGLARKMAMVLIQFLGEKYAVIALILLVNIMMLGGISGFIIIFTIYPIALNVFNALKIPKRFIFGLIGVAMATYMIGAFPGSLQVQNIIPTMALDSTIYSGFFLGLILTIYLFITGTFYLMWRIKPHLSTANSANEFLESKILKSKDFLVFSPLFVVLLVNLILSLWILPSLIDESHSLTLTAINISLTIGIIITYLMKEKRIDDLKKPLVASLKMALKPLLFVGTTFAFGSVISAMPFIATIKTPILSLTPYISLPLTVALFAGISGSATGGLSIAFPFLGDGFIEAITVNQVDQNLLHRLAVMSSVTIDTLPTNGTTLTMLNVTKLTYKEIYLDYFLITVLNTTIATLIGIILVIYA